MIKAKKSLGQHFLFDKNICSAIVDSSVPIAGKVVVEVGPGHGSLTDVIIERDPKQLFLIEKDSDLAQRLMVNYACDKRITVLEGDALKFTIGGLTNEKVIIISNLPYNIGTELLCNWLCYERGQIEHLTLMMQKEVVERICALPRTADYGRLSVLCQYLASVEKSFDVGKEAFTPPPKVTSAILQVSPFDYKIDDAELKKLQKVLLHAFSLRRKMIKTSLKALFSQADLALLGIVDTRRPEELTVADFVRLAQFIVN